MDLVEHRLGRNAQAMQDEEEERSGDDRAPHRRVALLPLLPCGLELVRKGLMRERHAR